jgi:hypothetical protein
MRLRDILATNPKLPLAVRTTNGVYNDNKIWLIGRSSTGEPIVEYDDEICTENDADVWELWIEPKKQVPHWPAVYLDASGIPWLTNILFVSQEEAAKYFAKNSYVRLVTELPSIYVEVDK